jgi:hypothetical protein
MIRRGPGALLDEYRSKLILGMSNRSRSIALLPAFRLEKGERTCSPFCACLAQGLVVDLIIRDVPDRHLKCCRRRRNEEGVDVPDWSIWRSSMCQEI